VALSSRLRNGLNGLLGNVGLELSTTRRKRETLKAIARFKANEDDQRPLYEAGLRFEDAGFLEFLSSRCLPYRHEYAALPRYPTAPDADFYLDNQWFGAVDAEVLYCIIREFRPRHIVEIGSGFSTRLMRRAIAAGDQETTLTCVDPEPRVSIERYADRFLRLPVEQVAPLEITGDLAGNDVLFVDSSHIVAATGDVVRIYLQLLPQLSPGVLVHIHDIFLPYDYPQQWLGSWVEHSADPWTEQYLVHAFLQGNAEYEVLWSSRYMWACHRAAVLNVFPNASDRQVPTSLWIRKLSSSSG
jgi:predicted O-methyltransferase YrrM